MLVSVVDAEVNFEITHKELLNSVNWEKGWLDLTKKESITKDYSKYKSRKQQNESNSKFLLIKIPHLIFLNLGYPTFFEIPFTDKVFITLIIF